MLAEDRGSKERYLMSDHAAERGTLRSNESEQSSGFIVIGGWVCTLFSISRKSAYSLV